MIISINGEKSSDKLQYPFMIEAVSKPVIEGELSQLGKDYLQKKKPIANITLNMIKLEAIPLRSCKKQGGLL